MVGKMYGGARSVKLLLHVLDDGVGLARSAEGIGRRIDEADVPFKDDIARAFASS